MTQCQIEERDAGRPYPRTCPTCGFGGRCVKGLDPKSLKERVDTLEKLDSEAATYVESIIVQRTHFTGEYPYVGWRGLGLALNETLDELEYFKMALNVALKHITPHLPGDSRAVPDWFVACAAVQCGLKDRDGGIKECLEKA